MEASRTLEVGCNLCGSPISWDLLAPSGKNLALSNIRTTNMYEVEVVQQSTMVFFQNGGSTKTLMQSWPQKQTVMQSGNKMNHVLYEEERWAIADHCLCLSSTRRKSSFRVTKMFRQLEKANPLQRRLSDYGRGNFQETRGITLKKVCQQFTQGGRRRRKSTTMYFHRY